ERLDRKVRSDRNRGLAARPGSQFSDVCRRRRMFSSVSESPRGLLPRAIGALLLVFWPFPSPSFSAPAPQRLRLESRVWTVVVDPASLRVDAEPHGKARVALAAPRETPCRV